MISFVRETTKKLARTCDVKLSRVRNDEPHQIVRGLTEHQIDVVLDVGANAGQFAKSMREADFAGDIVCFEPLPEAHEKLRKNFRKDKQTFIHTRTAIGDERGSIQINVSRNSVSSSILALLPSHSDAAPESAYIDAVDTDIDCLDNVLSIGTCSPEADPVLRTGGDKNNPCFGDRRFRQYNFVNQVIDEERPDFVIMMSSWPSNSKLAPAAQDDLVRRIGKRISQLEELGANFILVLPRPRLHTHIKNCYSRPFRPTTYDRKVSETEARSEFSGISSRLAALAESHSNLGIFDQFPIFCNEGVCEFRNAIGPLLRDEEVEHLSLLGSEIFAQSLSVWARERMPFILARPNDMDNVLSATRATTETLSAAEMN